MWKKSLFFSLIAILLVGALVALWPTLENMTFEAKRQTISDVQFKYHWYIDLKEDDRYKSTNLREDFVRFRDRLEKEGPRIPDWVDEELPNQEN